jgi:tetratricopeptide (TPR) repeat protein
LNVPKPRFGSDDDRDGGSSAPVLSYSAAILGFVPAPKSRRRYRVSARAFVALVAAVAAFVAGAQGPPASRAAGPASRNVAAPASRPSPDEIRAAAGKLYRERRFDELLDLVKPELADAAAAADLWLMAAEASFALEDFEAAIARFERATRLRPDLAALAANLGLAYVRADRLDDARTALKRFLTDDRPERRAKARYGMGLVAVAEGDTAAAAAAFSGAAELAPDDARPRYRLGLLALEERRFDAAAESFRDALVRDRLHHGAAYGLARALRGQGKAADAAAAEAAHAQLIEVSESIRRTLRELATSKNRAQTCFNLASLHAIAKDKAAAEYWLDRSLAADPRFPPAVALKPQLDRTEFGRP